MDKQVHEGASLLKKTKLRVEIIKKTFKNELFFCSYIPSASQRAQHRQGRQEEGDHQEPREVLRRHTGEN